MFHWKKILNIYKIFSIFLYTKIFVIDKFHFFNFIFHKKIVQSNTHKILLKMNNFKKLLYKSNILSNPPILFHARSQSSKSDIFFIYRRTTAKKNIVFRSCILIFVWLMSHRQRKLIQSQIHALNALRWPINGSRLWYIRDEIIRDHGWTGYGVRRDSSFE